VKVDGIHHVTAITADVEANLDFYARLLGLRLVWQGVNADDPEMRHVAYGDELGSPGSVVTFLEMPRVSPGRAGAGMVYRLLLRVADEEALDFWERRLARNGVSVERSGNGLVFADPDGLGLELVIDDGDDAPLVAWAADVDEYVALRGVHGVHAYSSEPALTTKLFGELLGMQRMDAGRWLAVGRRHGEVIYDEPPGTPGQLGAGTMHHIAFVIRDGEEHRWHELLAGAGLRPTPVMDRVMAKSIYFREPGGVLFELATDEPGFLFEPVDRLGESLVLVGDLESNRAELESRFPLLPNPRATTYDNQPQAKEANDE
jgi:glyoxalase family protein